MTRSLMERELRALIDKAGLPAPQTNTRTAFESDRRKDAAPLVAGERVMRVTGRRLGRRPEEHVARLAAAISTMRPRDAPLVN
jgi:hypothetical protein